MNYQVCEMYEAIQGEGFLAGTPVTLLRLQGCTVGCPWCDTKHSWDAQRGESKTPSELVDMWKVIKCASDWLMITGGEPSEQPMRDLVTLFVDFGASIMVETSGTGTGLLNCHELIDHVVLSPKAHKLPTLENLEVADELKLVVRSDADVLFWNQYLQGRDVARKRRHGMEVSVQPEFGSRPESTKAAVRAAHKYGWRLSFQMHKLLGLR